MLYSRFLKKGDYLGITALSCGCKKVLDELKLSINNLEKSGYHVIITDDIYGDDLVSGSKEKRCLELNQLLDKDIKLILIARGGNFLYETIPLIDFDKIKKKEIWIGGYSDPTSLLYILTTKYDVATIYGMNGKSYDNLDLLYQQNNLDILSGKLVIQKSFPFSKNKSIYGDFTSQGIIIGGCIEVLKDLIGTKYDTTIDFINKYKKVIWYFDIYDMSSINLYLTLLQFKEAGWFKNSDTFILGEVLIKNENLLSYEEALRKVFHKDCNVVIDANIGHIRPSFTIINGSMAKVKYVNNILEIKEEVNNENIS